MNEVLALKMFQMYKKPLLCLIQILLTNKHNYKHLSLNLKIQSSVAAQRKDIELWKWEFPIILIFTFKSP